MTARGLREPPAAKALLIGAALLYVGVMLLLPLGAVLVEAFKKGWEIWLQSISDADARSSIKLTLIVAAIAVPLNTIFGIAAAWAIAKFDFRGKSALVSFIELPFSVSPVVSGLVFVLIFGAQGWLGPWLDQHDIHIIFALPGLVLATVFVTFPFVARQLIPLMTAQGRAAEEAALTLGASGWQTFWHVTLPNIRFGLRPRHGRIWSRQRRFRSHPRQDEHHAAASRGSLQ
jgi:sulfate transport system permease protein